MKNGLFVIGILTLFCYCEKKTTSSAVPDHVKDSFMVKYPMAANIEWKVQHDKYAAVFDSANQRMEAEYNANGNFMGNEKSRLKE